MQPHVNNYLKHFGYTIADVIMCEVCENARANDVHHIIPRSKFGKKRKSEQDDVSNLIALCRKCHDKAHDGTLSKEYLFFNKKV